MRSRRRVSPLKAAPAFAVLLLPACGLLDDDQDLTRRAEQALSEHRVADAIPDLNSALQKNPANVAARVALARARIESGDFQVAAEALKQAVAAGATAAATAPLNCRLAQEQGQSAEALKACEPASDLPERIRADMLASQAGATLASGDLARAETLANAALRLDPQSARSHLALALAIVSAKGVEAAGPSFAKAISLNPNDPRAPLAQGQALATAGNLKGAEQSFRDAIGAARRYQHGFARLVAYTYLVDVLLRQDETTQALATAAELVDWSPNNTLALRTQGRALLTAGKASEARTVLEKAVAGAPGDGAARVLLSLAHEKLGNGQQAEAQLTALVAQDPGSAFGRRALAELRLRSGKQSEALAALAPLLEGPSPDGAAMLLAGRIGLATGDLSNSLAMLERAVAIRPDDAASVLPLAQAYLLAGRVDDAVSALKSFSGADSKDARDAMLALAALQGQELPEALDLATRVARDDRSSKLARSLAITVLASPALPEGGKSVLQELADKDPRSVQPRLALAGLLDARGDFTGALRNYAAVLKLEPSNRSALAGYARAAVRTDGAPEAVKVLKSAMEQGSASPEVGVLLTDVYLSQNDLESAKTLTAELSARYPADPGVLLRRGALLASGPSPKDAIPVLQKAVELQPRLLESRIALSRAQMIAQDTEGARLTITQLAKDFDDAPSALAAAARLAILARDDKLARTLIQRLRERDKGAVLSTVLRAELAASKGDFAGAVDTLSRAQKVAPSFELAYREYVASRQAGAVRLGSLERYVKLNAGDTRAKSVLATLYLENARPQDARREYEELLRVEPDDALALNNLAWIYAEQKDSRAVETAQRAARQLPGRADVLDTLAFAQLQAGEPAAAVRTLVDAMKAGTDEPILRYRLAVAYEASRQPKKAAEALRALLEGPHQFPQRADAERMLSRLQGEGNSQ